MERNCKFIKGGKIKALHTPGHSPGHLCFYDIENKYLFIGDLLY